MFRSYFHHKAPFLLHKQYKYESGQFLALYHRSI
nr:MAG TPA: hypothetical protein [Caudoviricetes sp.]